MYRFEVSGMSCGHCVAKITDSVKMVDPSAIVTADTGNGDVRVASDLDAAAIARAIGQAGYLVLKQQTVAGGR